MVWLNLLSKATDTYVIKFWFILRCMMVKHFLNYTPVTTEFPLYLLVL